MDKKPKKIHENLIPTKIKQPYSTVLIHIRITIRNTNISYNWPASSYLNSGYMSPYALVNTKGHIAIHTISF